MLTECLPLRALILSVAGWVHREQQRTIAYLVEENRVLKEQLGGWRLRLAFSSHLRPPRASHEVGSVDKVHQ